jgi:hypothetical protein
MTFDGILQEIDAQIQRLQRAKALLSGGNGGIGVKRGAGRPKFTGSAVSFNHGANVASVKKKRTVSPAARKKIAAAQKKRWALVHKAAQQEKKVAAERKQPAEKK